jgi:hypothetical protein
VRNSPSSLSSLSGLLRLTKIPAVKARLRVQPDGSNDTHSAASESGEMLQRGGGLALILTVRDEDRCALPRLQVERKSRASHLR